MSLSARITVGHIMAAVLVREFLPAEGSSDTIEGESIRLRLCGGTWSDLGVLRDTGSFSAKSECLYP